VKHAFQLLVLCLVVGGAGSCRATAAEASARPAPESGTGSSETSPRFSNSAWRQPSGPRVRVVPPEVAIPRFSGGDLPAYPEASVRGHEEGAVDLRFELRENGSVGGLEIERSSGHPRLDSAALAAARTWRFNPTTGGGDAEVIRYRLEFRLVDG